MPFNSEHHSNFADAQDKAGSEGNGAWDDGSWDNAGGNNSSWDNEGPFARHSWFARLHAQCLVGQTPVVVTSGDADRAVRLYCVRDASGAISAMANWYSFSWGPLWRGATDSASRVELAAAAFAQITASAARITLCPVGQADGTADLLIAALRRGGWRVLAEPTGRNHWLETRGRGFAEWWAARPGALRSTVQRKAKKGRVTIAISDQFSDAAWDDYEAVYRQSWKPPESHAEFLRAWARDEAAAGRLRLGIARIDGLAVAAQFWTVDFGVAYIHKLAHIAGHDALSPGTLLTHALFAHAFNHDRVARIDFGTGDDGYKRDWMEESAPLVTIYAWNLEHAAAWPSFARAMLSHLRAKFSRLAARPRHG